MNAEASAEGMTVYGAARIGSLWRVVRATRVGAAVAHFDNLTTAEAYLMLRGMAHGYRHAREDRHIAVFGGVNAAYAASAEGGDR